jgi:phosphatidylserine/phosphatidylglycerophosphate/cardiolipin synthase-like enzyme
MFHIPTAPLRDSLVHLDYLDPKQTKNSSKHIKRDLLGSISYFAQQFVKGLQSLILRAIQYFKKKNDQQQSTTTTTTTTSAPNPSKKALSSTEIQIENLPKIKKSKWKSDNSVLITKNAKETNEWKLDFIKNAKQSIEISGCYCGGEVFREALNAIKDRLQKNPKLKVHILSTPDFLEKADKKLLKYLAKTYPDNFHYVISTFKLNSSGYRIENHSKLLVVDEKYIVLGGTNYQDRLVGEADKDEKPTAIADNLFGIGSNDMDVVARGTEIASELRQEFFNLYSTLENKEKVNIPLKSKETLTRYFSIKKNKPRATSKKFENEKRVNKGVVMKAVTGSADTPVNNCTEEYVRLIKKTTRKVTIAQMYLHPPQEIIEAIDSLQQESKSVHLRIITAGTDSDLPYANQFYGYANEKFYMSVLEKNENAKVYTYNPHFGDLSIKFEFLKI